MKIVYLVHQFFPEFQSGTENFVYNVALMTQKVGNKVKVITYSGYDDAAYDHEDNGILSKELIYRGIPVLAFKYKNPPIDLTYALANESMHGFARRVLEAEAPDILHVGHSMRVHPFIGAAAELKIPYLLTLTDFFLLCPKVILAPNAESLCGGPLGGGGL